ncbi:MAG: hypothetical protein ACRCWO_11915 [Bosea sp. (in: a-proteobacteria)]
MSRKQGDLPKLIEFTRESVEGERGAGRYTRQSWSVSAKPLIVPALIFVAAGILIFAATRWSRPLLAKVWSYFA